MSPFKALYGRDATSIHDYVPGSTQNGSIEASMIEHQRILGHLKESIAVAKHQMEVQANKKRLDKEFATGDFVYLRLQNYRQSSVVSRNNLKLSRRFYGPYKILERIGKVAYKLDLPRGSRIHPVFHVSRLKQSYGDAAANSGNLDAFEPEDELHFLPEKILDQRTNETNGAKQLLVKWEKHPLEEATWEDTDTLNAQFPGFTDIEGNVDFEEVGIDMDQTNTEAHKDHVTSSRPKRESKKPARFAD